MSLPIRYVAGSSTGVAFTEGVSVSVAVTSEALDPITGYEGDPITYTATVKDSLGAALPATFVVDLLFDSTKVVTAQALDSSVYDPSTFLLTLPFNLPAGSGGKTVKLSWAQQEI